MHRMYGALAALGVDEPTRWAVLTRIAIDCAPALRALLMRLLREQDDWARTSDLATAAGLVTKTASRALEDLALLGIADHDKSTDANNAPDTWAASMWLRTHWPEAREK